jgi:hypothetical protein
MDAFEYIVGLLLEREGYWVRRNYRVEFEPEDRKKIVKSKSPRRELDIVAYKVKTNELRVVECKSFLNSTGVHPTSFNKSNKRGQKRYKLFHDKKLKELVFMRLVDQLIEKGALAERVEPKLCLAAGKVAEGERESLNKLFKENDWCLWDDECIKGKLKRLAAGKYENEVTDMVVKMLLKK